MRRTLNTGKVLDRLYGNRQTMPCFYCKKNILRRDATFDHKKPLSAGGYDKGKNGVISCLTCNQAKGSMTVEQFINLRINHDNQT